MRLYVDEPLPDTHTSDELELAWLPALSMLLAHLDRCAPAGPLRAWKLEMLTNRNFGVFGLKAGTAVRPADPIAPNLRELEALTCTGVDRIARRSAPSPSRPRSRRGRSADERVENAGGPIADILPFDDPRREFLISPNRAHHHDLCAVLTTPHELRSSREHHPTDPVRHPAGNIFNDPTGLPECLLPEVVELADGDTFDLRITPVVKQLGDDRVRMLAYNGSIPGPTLRVRQGSDITVQVRNDGDVEATVHWHGLRLDNRYDGVPHETQEPIAIGDTFSYHLRFPDAGLYWYHPHIREDYGLDMGLYGNLVVVPTEPDYWPPVNREVVVTLDDVLVEGGRIAPFHQAGANYVAMGRFGNVMLIGGQTSLDLQVHLGEVVRFYFTNTANTRLFNVAVPGARMKLVGGDSGAYEHETFVDQVLLAPSERAIIDVLFDTPGRVPLEHRTPDHHYPLGAIVVSHKVIAHSSAGAFDMLRTSGELAALRTRIEADRDRPPDKTLALESLMPLLYSNVDQTATAWTCPMHPDIIGDQPGTCPICWMKLIPTGPGAAAAAGHAHGHDSADGLEWEDLMPEINRTSDSGNMTWKLVDRDTGKANEEIDWAFQVGDQVKIRLVNDLAQAHPMHHPFHIHGAGRFVILSRDDEPEANLVWKDTVLIRANQTVDILLDVTNPGRWMAHCHIAEHNQNGMMFSFPVTDKTGRMRESDR